MTTRSQYRDEILGALRKFASAGNVAAAHGLFLTRVPSVAPEGFLNKIFEPKTFALVSAIAHEYELPQEYVSFLLEVNGMRLFFDHFSVFGIADEGRLIDRSSPFGMTTFSLVEMIETCKRLPFWGDHLIPVGWYCEDGSLAFLHKTEGTVLYFQDRKLNRTPIRWKTFREWLLGEIDRIAALHDSDGVLFVDGSMTLPDGTVS